MNLYIGNLSYNVTSEQLKAAFAAHGEVTSAEVIADKRSGRSRGYGFVQMGSEQQGHAAIQAMNGVELAGRPLKVDESKPNPVPRAERPRRSRSGSRRMHGNNTRSSHNHGNNASGNAVETDPKLGLFGRIKNFFS